MAKIAVLGYGVVGSGVSEVIRKNNFSIASKAGEEIVVKYILDIREFPESPDKDLITSNADLVFNDPEVSIIVETIGGARAALDFTTRALKSGKHVVTSNKELVAAHGPELLQLARENRVHYLFEASVGGGIPIIRPLNQCLAANDISAVTGILNGTTNYILTQMRREGKDFKTALAEAQKNGYAEADPTADIEGHDACRKIAILSSIAYNEFIDYKEIFTEGIPNITLEDMQYAEELGAVIKLVAMSRKSGDRIFARVSPLMLDKNHPLSNVEDVFNAIVVSGDAIGDAMFYGRGAGKLPTASAVIADVIDIVKNPGSSGRNNWQRKTESCMLDIKESETRMFIRVRSRNAGEAKRFINTAFGEVEFVSNEKTQLKDEVAFVTGLLTEEKLEMLMEGMKNIGSISSILSAIRVNTEE